MQTFLPISDFRENAMVLDFKRLGKQRVEAAQILANLGVEMRKTNGEPFKPTHKNHPCVKMWRGFEEALKFYYNEIVSEWITRGYKNNMKFLEVCHFELPPFIGNKGFHDSHKSNLLRKNFEHYSQFNWDVSLELDYVWGEIYA